MDTSYFDGAKANKNEDLCINMKGSRSVSDTGFVPDERTNSTITSHWIYHDVFRGVKVLKGVEFQEYTH